jgi:chitinase
MASAAAPAGGKRVLGLKPRTALIAGGAILAGAVAYFWWKRKQAPPASTSASSSASAGAYSTAAQLEAMQLELDELMTSSASTGAGSGSGSGSGGGTGTGTTTTTPPAKTTTPPAKTTTPPAKTAAKPKPAMPAGVRAAKVTSNSVTLTWAKDPNATTYTVRVTYQGKLVGSPHITTGTSVTVSGLGADHTYTFHVAATGPGGTSAETNGPAVKTSR